MIDVYAIAGTFPDKHQLTVDLASALMAIEQVPDIPMFRLNTAAFVHDLPSDGLSNVDGESGYVRIQVLTNHCALDRDKQLAVVREFTEIVARSARDPTLAAVRTHSRARSATWLASCAVHDKAAADDGLSVVGVDVLSAFRAYDADFDAVTAWLVQQLDWRGGKGGPRVAPLHQRGVDGKQRAPLGREPVLVARGILAICSALENAVVDQPVEPVGQHVARQADPTLEVFESARAVERLAQDDPHPALADDPRGARDRAVLVE
jgi:hypothetical protein